MLDTVAESLFQGSPERLHASTSILLASVNKDFPANMNFLIVSLSAFVFLGIYTLNFLPQQIQNLTSFRDNFSLKNIYR